jgi:hypothetical protein
MKSSLTSHPEPPQQQTLTVEPLHTLKRNNSVESFSNFSQTSSWGGRKENLRYRSVDHHHFDESDCFDDSSQNSERKEPAVKVSASLMNPALLRDMNQLKGKFKSFLGSCQAYLYHVKRYQ